MLRYQIFWPGRREIEALAFLADASFLSLLAITGTCRLADCITFVDAVRWSDVSGYGLGRIMDHSHHDSLVPIILVLLQTCKYGLS
jgi:hypothetical protein